MVKFLITKYEWPTKIESIELQQRYQDNLMGKLNNAGIAGYRHGKNWAVTHIPHHIEKLMSDG